ncbi:hypothetical protein OIU76_009114 [Salix suchowensis]|nr:hypothetical protein OIU76_009114 [Salix suchowensis]
MQPSFLSLSPLDPSTQILWSFLSSSGPAVYAHAHNLTFLAQLVVPRDLLPGTLPSQVTPNKHQIISGSFAEQIVQVLVTPIILEIKRSLCLKKCVEKGQMYRTFQRYSAFLNSLYMESIANLYAMVGVSFTLEDFHSALHVYNLNSEIGARVKGTIFMTDNNGALADITAKSSAYLRAQEASVHRIKAPGRSWYSS